MGINEMGNGLAALVFPTVGGLAIQLGNDTILGLVDLFRNILPIIVLVKAFEEI